MNKLQTLTVAMIIFSFFCLVVMPLIVITSNQSVIKSNQTVIKSHLTLIQLNLK